MSAQRRWKTEEEIERIFDTLVQRHTLKRSEEIETMIDLAMAERFSAFEARIEPTLKALVNGAQSSILTNVLLVGDGQFVTEGFIQKTERRMDGMEKRQDEMHAENKATNRRLIKRQGVIIRCVKYFSGKEGAARRHALTAAAAAVGSGATFAVQHFPAWWHILRTHLR